MQHWIEIIYHLYHDNTTPRFIVLLKDNHNSGCPRVLEYFSDGGSQHSDRRVLQSLLSRDTCMRASLRNLLDSDHLRFQPTRFAHHTLEV